MRDTDLPLTKAVFQSNPWIGTALVEVSSWTKHRGRGDAQKMISTNYRCMPMAVLLVTLAAKLSVSLTCSASPQRFVAPRRNRKAGKDRVLCHQLALRRSRLRYDLKAPKLLSDERLGKHVQVHTRNVTCIATGEDRTVTDRRESPVNPGGEVSLSHDGVLR